MNPTKQKLQAVAPAIFEGAPVLFAYLYGSHVKALSHRYSDLDIGIYIEDKGMSFDSGIKFPSHLH